MSLLHTVPGETPIDDLSGLKFKGITTRSELNLPEAQNILKTAEKYFLDRLTRKKVPFDYAWALRLHGEMFGDVWAWAGKLRQHNLNIGVPWGQVEGRLYELFKKMEYWVELDWFDQEALLHHEAVFIHPFTNGNGRWSRMLANIWLRLNGQPLTAWPEDAVGEASPIRAEYLTAIQAADNGDYDPLVGLHRRFAEPPSP